MRIGRLRWKPYKQIKRQILATLSDDITTAISSISEDAIKAGGDTGALREVGFAVAKIAGRVGEVLEDINEDFVRGCMDRADLEFIDMDQLTLPDMDRLFSVALKLNPLDEILEREKNSPAASLGRALMNGFGGVISSAFRSPDPSPDGGSESSPSLDEVAAGAYTESES